MKGQAVYDCKAHCEALGSCCHNTKNRCIEKMCKDNKSDCKKIAKYLQCLMVCECLCSYVCMCCCEMEEVSDSCLTELCGKCDKLLHCCKDLKGCLPKDMCDYLNCDKLMGCSNDCKKSKGSKGSKNKKKSKKK